jgi:simple sugar transport system ATP-binding protein
MNFIELKDITKIYPGTVACDKVSVGFQRGEVHTLLGENGAGKSTLMNVLYGLAKPDGGEILVNGKSVVIDSPKAAIACGIGMVHQHFMLIPTLSVVENVILSLDEKKVFINKKKIAARIDEIAHKYGLVVDPYAKVSSLTVGQQQRVEIIKALYKNCDLLVLDEPTAVLTPQETKELFVAIRNLLAEDKAVIFISHKLNEVMEISQTITILHLGKVVGTVDPKNTDARQLASMMVGKEVSFEVEKAEQKLGKTMLQVEDMHAKDSKGVETVRGLNLQVRAGEIYGIAGVDGNGQSELIRGIAGLCKKTGKVLIGGTDVSKATPREVLDHGVAHVPEDRQGMGIVMNMSIRNNLVLDTFYSEKFTKGVFLDWKKVDQQAAYLIENYHVKTPNASNNVHSLSGGNQQKMVVARYWIKSRSCFSPCIPPVVWILAPRSLFMNRS